MFGAETIGKVRLALLKGEGIRNFFQFVIESSQRFDARLILPSPAQFPQPSVYGVAGQRRIHRCVIRGRFSVPVFSFDVRAG